MKIKLAYKIISPTAVFILVAVLFFVLFSVKSLESALIKSAFFRTNDQVHSRFNQNVTIEDIKNPYQPETQGRFSLVANEVADASTLHITIWDDKHVAIFSDNDALIGTTAADASNLVLAAQNLDGFYLIENSKQAIPFLSKSEGVVLMFIPVMIEDRHVIVEVETSLAVMTQPIAEHIRNMVTIMLAGGVIIVIMLVFILRTFVLSPVSGLRKAFRIFSQGNLSYHIEQNQHDELGELAQSVDSMRLNLEYTIGALKRERDQSGAIVSSIGEGLILMDRDYTVRIINSAAASMLSVDPNQYVNKPMTDLIEVYQRAELLPVSDWAVTKAMNSLKVSLHTLDEKVFYKTPSGKMIGVLVAATPFVVDKKLEGAIVVFRDVTSELQLDEAKDSFISIASHQLRTPLTSMRWFSEMLTNGDAGKLTDDQLHFIDQVYQGTLRMISLVNLLLQTARVEAGRVRVDPVPIRLDAITNEVVGSLKANLDAKKQTVTISSEPKSLPEVMMDRDIMWQVILNLLSNAVRYSPESGVIEVGMLLGKTDIQYSVKDHGIGIPVKDQSKIFQKFFRAPNALKAVPEGSGLGLALVKTLVTQWGGKLWFETEEGKGTTFFFTVPLAGMKAKQGDVKIVV